MYYLRTKQKYVKENIFKEIKKIYKEQYNLFASFRYFLFEYETREQILEDLTKIYWVDYLSEINKSGISDISRDIAIITEEYYKYNIHLLKCDLKIPKNFVSNLCFI